MPADLGGVIYLSLEHESSLPAVQERLAQFLSEGISRDPHSCVEVYFRIHGQEHPPFPRLRGLKGPKNHIPLTFGAIGVHIVRLHDLRAACKSQGLCFSAAMGAFVIT